MFVRLVYATPLIPFEIDIESSGLELSDVTDFFGTLENMLINDV